MAQPRFRQYTRLAHTPKERKPLFGPGCRRGFLGVLVVFALLLLVALLVIVTPVRNSLGGEYKTISSLESVEPYSRARWMLADGHTAQLSAGLGWFQKSRGESALNTTELDSAGFRPFIFFDEQNLPVVILDSSADPADFSEDFILAILQSSGVSSSFMSRRTREYGNVIGTNWPEQDEQIIPVEVTSVHAQFLPDRTMFSEEYMCYLSEVWESMVSSFVMIYQSPPSDLDDLLDGLGLVPNPDCVWPFDPEEELVVSCEGGLINGEIIYWQVTLLDSESRGQARYWDAYTSYNDPDTPEKIIAGTTSSTVVDPGMIEGQRHVLFSPEIVRNLLDSVRQPTPEEELEQHED